MPINAQHLARLMDAIRAAGVPITGIDVNGNVAPAGLQAAAQPTIDGFDASQAAQDAYDAQAARAPAVDAIDNNRAAAWKVKRAILERLADELTMVYQAIPRPITSITRSGTTATVNTMGAHGFGPNGTTREVVIFGADLAAYNGVKQITVTSANTFTYGGVAGNPTTPAPGSIFYALNADVPPLERTLQQAVTALKNTINNGVVD